MPGVHDLIIRKNFSDYTLTQWKNKRREKQTIIVMESFVLLLMTSVENKCFKPVKLF